MAYVFILVLLLVTHSSAHASDSGNASDDDAAIAPASRARPIVSSSDAETDWDGLMRSSTRFLIVQHSFRLLTEAGTRDGLGGPFVRDYLRSVGRIRGWSDTDPFVVNYVGHPMMGAVTGFLYLQHTGSSGDQQFGKSRDYWKKRLRAMTYSAAYSTQFELGPVSEASIGNVGYDYQTMGAVDLVVTPVAGTGWLIAEDIIDRFLIERIEGWAGSMAVRIPARCLLNPGRTFANLMQGRVPWKRGRGIRAGR